MIDQEMKLQIELITQKEILKLLSLISSYTWKHRFERISWVQLIGYLTREFQKRHNRETKK